MKLTNKYGMPDTIVRFAENDTYDAGASNITATSLIDSPRVTCLKKKHWNEMESDVSDRLWALMGTALHHVMEHTDSATTIPEERLFVTRKGWVISGQIDAQVLNDDDTITVGDYKFTSVWAVMNEKPEWEKQLNIYAWLVEENKALPVKELHIYAMCRDWNRRDISKPNYPQTPLVVVNIPVWTQAQREEYVLQRLSLHAEGDVARTLGEEPVFCTAEEQWRRDETYAVKKPANKRALKVFPTREEAVAFSRNAVGTIVEVRPAVATRCVNNFCGVADWCSQFKQEQQNVE